MAEKPPSSSGTFSAASLAQDLQEVKGLVLATVREYVLEKHHKSKWDELMYLLPRRTSEAFENPQITEWYPETDMRRFVHLAHELLADNSDEKFLELSRNVALTGINRFFRMIPTLTSSRFVLRQIPTLFSRIRRGTATVSTVVEGGEVSIHYIDYRYCRDRMYRLMALGSCQAAVFAATKKIPVGEVRRWDRASMTLAFKLDE